jgi:formate hydrogenlyase subunit 3/multisubunit Na+/H+ antiporter MnhD subunit
MGNDAHAHLLVNHFPIVAAFLAVPMLLLALLLRKERGLLLASVLLLVVTAASGWASLTTGETAMEYFNDKEDSGAAWTDDVDGAAIAEHEERAEKSMYVAVPTALVGLLALVLAHRRPAENPLPRWWFAILFVGAGLTAVAMAYVGDAGGPIVHREIRGDSVFSSSDEKK